MNNILNPPGVIAYGRPVEILKDRLYFHTYEGIPKSDNSIHYFTVDNEVTYESFYNDFGPLNLAVLYRYCLKMKKKLNSGSSMKKRLVHYTCSEPKKRVNSAYLIGAFAIIYLDGDPEKLWREFHEKQEPPKLIGFRDAAMGPSSYDLHVLDVWRGVKKAVKFGWLDFTTFDVVEYEYYERVETGDFNWIIPGKFLAFCGPHEESVVENGYPYHAPNVYFDYFRDHKISTIIRLNKKIYDAQKFSNAGFRHVDLFFVDGSTPSESIVRRFLDAVDSSPGGCAVHCKAGLGRTGTLIGCWMMRDFGLTAPETIAWCRICRPGSIIGPQQAWLIQKQEWCWSMNKSLSVEIRKQREEINCKPSNPRLIEHCSTNNIQPINSDFNKEVETAPVIHRPAKSRALSPAHPNGIRQLATKVDDITLSVDMLGNFASTDSFVDETSVNEKGESQGDRLLAIKAHKAAISSHNHHHHHPPPTTHHATEVVTTKTTTISFPPPTSATINAAARFTSPTTPIKPVSARGIRTGHGSEISWMKSGVPSNMTAIREEKTPTPSPSTSSSSRRSLNFNSSSPSTSSYPHSSPVILETKKIPRIIASSNKVTKGLRRNNESSASTSKLLGHPPKILRGRSSRSSILLSATNATSSNAQTHPGNKSSSHSVSVHRKSTGSLSSLPSPPPTKKKASLSLSRRRPHYLPHPPHAPSNIILPPHATSAESADKMQSSRSSSNVGIQQQQQEGPETTKQHSGKGVFSGGRLPRMASAHALLVGGSKKKRSANSNNPNKRPAGTSSIMQQSSAHRDQYFLRSRGQSSSNLSNSNQTRIMTNNLRQQSYPRPDGVAAPAYSSKVLHPQVSSVKLSAPNHKTTKSRMSRHHTTTSLATFSSGGQGDGGVGAAEGVRRVCEQQQQQQQIEPESTNSSNRKVKQQRKGLASSSKSSAALLHHHH